MPRLHVVTDDAVLAREGWLRDAQCVMEACGTAVALHLRGPRSEGARIYELARTLRSDAARTGALLVVNDRVDVAMAADVGAVHLGERSLPVAAARALLGSEARLGVSAHGVDGIVRARAGGADYAFLGAIRPTPSHGGRPAIGLEGLRAGLEASGRVPLIGIGGIGLEHVGAVVGTGAHGVAVVRGVWDSPEPGAAGTAYVRAIEGARHG